MIGQIKGMTVNTEIICEIASAHEGKLQSLLDLLSVAESSGSDWVKLQIYQFDKLVATDNERFSDLKIIELLPEDWIRVLNFSQKLTVKIIVEPFDYDSFLLIKDHPAIDGFKIPTSDLLDELFVTEILAETKKVFVAVGGTELAELDAIMTIAKNYPHTEVILLHGFQNFPTRLEDSLLNKIASLIDRYGCRVGFADHIDAAEQELSRTLPSMAIAAGACIIEKHLTLDRSKKSYDYYSALNPDEFFRFVQHIRQVTHALGTHDLSRLSNAEREYRNNMKKFAVAAKDISAGLEVGQSEIVYRRTLDPGLTHTDMDKMKSKKFRYVIKKNTVLSIDDFE